MSAFAWPEAPPAARRTLAPMQVAVNDEALAAAFATKAPWAFEEAYRRYGALLYSTAWRCAWEQHEDAQDCVHDALTRVWRSPDSYARSRGAVRSFLVVCVRNEAITRVRSGRRVARSARAARCRPNHASIDELGAVDVIEHARLRVALNKLSPEQRAPLELAYFEQKTHTEIAKELEQPLGTIKSRIAMGLRKLAAALAPPS